jgi:GT2 family glycosyltransferase
VPRVVVSLVTHNESKDIELLLPTLAAQTFRDFEVVAVDNASEDGTRGGLASWQKRREFPLRILHSRENLGFTGGHNKGIETALQADAEWVLVLNADVVLAPDFLERLLEDAEAPGHDRVGAVTGKILRADGPALERTDVLDTVGIWMTRTGRHFDLAGGERDNGRYDRPAEVFGVSGCVALYRRAALEDVRISTGFFDNDFFLYREDVDLAWRLRGRGWTARCVPSARAWHRRRNLPERRRQMSRLSNLHSVKNRFLLRINNAGTDHLTSTFGGTLVRDLLVVGGCLTFERSSYPGLQWLARNRQRLLEKRAEIQSRRTRSDRDLLHWFISDPAEARSQDA